MESTRVVILPGNGNEGDVFEWIWYAWLQDKLKEAHPSLEVVLSNMPDQVIGRASQWLPFMEKQLICDESTIIVGHSTGAIAAMRYAETHHVKGLVLASAYTTHHGDEREKASEYFDKPWDWAAIRANVGFIAQLGSTDDPYVNWHEMEEVSENLMTDMHKFTNKGHFMTSTFPEIFEVIETYIA